MQKKIRKIAQAHKYLFERPNTLALFDIDNTLMRPQNGPLGSHEWFMSLLEYGVNNGLSEQKSFALASQAHTLTQQDLIVEAVEPEAINLIAQLQAQGITTVALTARPDFLHQVTVKLLDSIGIHFASDTTQPVAFSQVPGTVLYKGILFCNRNKAATLACFLQLTQAIPARIVLIDDELHNLEALENDLAQKNIEFIGLHYTFVSTVMPSFVLEEHLIPQSFRDAIERNKIPTVPQP